VPHVIVKLWPGKSEQQKQRLAQAITQDVIKILHYGEESVSVAMEEIEAQDWVERCTSRKSKTDGTLSIRSPDTTRTTCDRRGLDTMEIRKVGSQPSSRGPADWFTGTVRIDPLFQAPDPAKVQGASVTFEPGARTAWHTHPLGQTLIVMAGCGWAQRDGGPVEEIRPGDVVWFAPGEKHWHGATPTTAMTHIAIQEKLGGKVVDWMEKVSDDEYRK